MGVWGEAVFQKGLPQITTLQAHQYQPRYRVRFATTSGPVAATGRVAPC